MKTYQGLYKSWQTNPVKFWLEAANDIDWISGPKRGFDPEAGIYGRWFPDATANTCYNCIDRHIKDGRGEQAAIIYDSPVTDQKITYSYNQLFHEVTDLGSGLIKSSM